MPRRLVPAATFPGTCSKAYSGVCTPMTSKPEFLYVEYHACTCGIARWQLMHEYAQKSTSTTLPLREAAEPSGVFSHFWMPEIAGAGPQSCGPVSAFSAHWASAALWPPPNAFVVPALFNAALSPAV